MLSIDCFKNIVTYEDLQNFVYVQEARRSEYNLDSDVLYSVWSDEYKNINYIVSTVCKGRVISHYFEYREGDNHFGLIRMTPNTDNFIKVSDSIYSRFSIITDSCIFMYKDDNTIDLITDNKIVAKLITDIEDIGIEGRISLLRLKFLDGSISLACLVNDNSHPPLFTPNDIDMFRDWYYCAIEELGYNGSLDDVPMSYIVGVLHEVISSCLVNKRYKPLINLKYSN